jgi:hypothetical protein
MTANVIYRLTPRRRPRGRAAVALLPGVFALMLVGVSGVAAAASPAASPTATPASTPSPRVCHHGTNAKGCCSRKNLCPTPTPTLTPTPSPSPTGGGNQGNPGGGGSTPTPTAAPTSTPAPTHNPAPTPTSKPVTTGGSGGSHSSPGSGSSGTSGGPTGDVDAARTQTQAVPTPFAPLTTAVTAVTAGQGLDAARIPPVEALTPLSGLDFGSGLNVGPILLLIDLIGIGMLFYLVRTRWLAAED